MAAALVMVLLGGATAARAACTPFGAACIPDSALRCYPYAGDATAKDCEFAHGLWRINHDNRLTDGTGTDHTIYWSDGCEMPRMTIMQPMQAQSIGAIQSLWISGAATSVRPDGSEYFELPGWGTLELWPGENDVRANWASIAAGGTVRDQMGAFLTVIPTGAGRNFILQYVRQDKLPLCAGRY